MSLPKVSIVITAYLPASKAYLDLCVQSIWNLDYPKELLETIIVAPESYHPMYEGALTISPPEPTYGCPRGLNFGIAQASNEILLVLNDDVILTKDCLKPLLNYMSIEKLGILMPIGNDMQMRYWMPLAVSGPYRLENLGESAKELMNAPWKMQTPMLMLHDTLCIYAYMIRKSVHDEIGGFDESLISSDDIDFCFRLRHKGYLNAIALDSLVWHAGGASADTTFTPEMRVRGKELFDQKWAGK